MQYYLTRNVTTDECPWLPRDVKAGEHVELFDGCTYGCISESGTACTIKGCDCPCLELPRDALEPVVGLVH